MKFWELFKGEEDEKARIKDLSITYYEVHQILNKEERAYDELRKSKNTHDVGTFGKFALSKIKKRFKSFFEKKYKYNKGKKK